MRGRTGPAVNLPGKPEHSSIEEIRCLGSTGPTYQRSTEDLASYGVAVLNAWISTGQIFDECATRGRAVQRPPLGALDPAEVVSMAGEVVAVALARFRSGVLSGRWDSSRGASLRTYFVGCCVLCFPNVYRSWLASVPDYDLDACSLLRRRGDSCNVEDEVLNNRDLVEALVLVRSEDARKAMMLWGHGYTYTEIGDQLGKTEKAVERMISYGRKQAREGGGGMRRPRSVRACRVG